MTFSYGFYTSVVYFLFLHCKSRASLSSCLILKVFYTCTWSTLFATKLTLKELLKVDAIFYPYWEWVKRKWGTNSCVLLCSFLFLSFFLLFRFTIFRSNSYHVFTLVFACLRMKHLINVIFFWYKNRSF